MTHRMEFCLLGPLLVRRDAEAVPVQRGKQRAVLAVLLLNAGRAVSADELAETLWGSSSPPSAQATLRNYVKRLRHSLGRPVGAGSAGGDEAAGAGDADRRGPAPGPSR